MNNAKLLDIENRKKEQGKKSKLGLVGNNKVTELVLEADEPLDITYPEGFCNKVPDIRFDKPTYIMGSEPPELRGITKETIYEVLGEERPEPDKALVLIIDGGTGDAIAASPMIKSAKEVYGKDKKIIVASSHADMLENNPYIDELYHLGAPGDLYDKWVKPLKHMGSVIKSDIYNAEAHKLFPGPLSMIWCYLYNLPYENDDIKIYLTDKEKTGAKDFIKSFQRPVILVHGTGGKLTFNPSVQITPNKDWDPGHWKTLVNHLMKDYDVIQIGGAQEEPIPGCAYYLMGGCSMRQTAALLGECLTYVAIDSFANHAGPAVGKAGVVLFGRSNPVIAGHAINRNIWIKGSCIDDNLCCGRPMGYFGDSEIFRGSMRPWVCPTRSCMKAITPGVVYDQVMDLIKTLK
jgi:ADP-heptose:LPS heptosyltransferase